MRIKDDTLSLWRHSREEFEMFKEELKTLKHRDERFKNIGFAFIVENEVDGKPGIIPFCDVRLMRDYVEARIMREVYRNLSNTNVYLNAKSNGP